MKSILIGLILVSVNTSYAAGEMWRNSPETHFNTEDGKLVIGHGTELVIRNKTILVKDSNGLICDASELQYTDKMENILLALRPTVIGSTSPNWDNVIILECELKTGSARLFIKKKL